VLADERLKRGLELGDVLEVEIDRGEADVGDSVEYLEVVHDELADLGGGAFALGCVHEEGLACVDDGLEPRGGDGALFAGAQQAAENLLALKALAAAVFFDDHVGNFVDALVGGEAAVALLAFTAAADGVGLFAFARVDYAVLSESAEWTLHILMILDDVA